MNREIKTIVIKPQPVLFKFVIGDCWKNISYKKAIRIANKRLRKQIIGSVLYWEEVSRLSRYDLYFNKAGRMLQFSTEPML